VLVAIRQHASLDACTALLRGNREHVLKAPGELVALFADLPEAVAETRSIAERCGFDLTQSLGYRPPERETDADRELKELCELHLDARYPASSPWRQEAVERLATELVLIRRHELAGFFLLHREILELARDVALKIRGTDAARNVLPPGRGRGSSVGSIVCYLTGLSHIDPVAGRLSLGRFLNEELASTPDIDLDFPRDIRAELIRRIHTHYGDQQAALVGAFATYRAKGAIREIGKALTAQKKQLFVTQEP
jgi:error-prone DNA polymerase